MPTVSLAIHFDGGWKKALLFVAPALNQNANPSSVARPIGPIGPIEPIRPMAPKATNDSRFTSHEEEDENAA